ncbi:MAG: hypothetical protein HY817_05180 [Candidatus Abawacabacteria bacterium]|nr:hypothetical protein [Candidatus Abawacabacteria bacterium]
MADTKSCLQCHQSFTIRDKDEDFYRNISPQIGEHILSVPTPTLCPECRLIRRLAARNETALYLRKSSLTGKDIISMYSPEAPYLVGEMTELRKDGFDAMQYQNDCDPKRAFFPQFHTFACKVPHQALLNFGGQEAIEYNNFAYEAKNCYLCFWGDYGQDSMYNYGYVNLKNCINNFWLFDGELCFQCVNSQYCFRAQYVMNSENISDSAFIADCKHLDHCMFCVNLHHKKYCIWNKQYTKEEYFEQKKAYATGSFAAWEKMAEEFANFVKTFPRRALRNFNVENCDQGDMNNNAKDCYVSFHMVEAERCCYGIDNMKAFNCYDCYGSVNMTHCYECYAVVNCQHCLWSFDCYDSSDLYYCQSCRNSHDLFGCIGLKNKQYCIFNKEYTKSEYEKLLVELINTMQQKGEWGEFFPSTISPFGYNESTAFEYFPTDKKSALQRGYHWSDYIAPKPQVDKFIAASDLPDDIQDAPNELVDSAVICVLSGRPFRITKQELVFYREFSLPLPRLHPDERRRALMRMKNPRKVRDAICANCSKSTLTSFSSESEAIIYCELCYQALLA